jgi:hypothetical protein
MMTRITATFLTLLLVATLTMGITWRQIESLTSSSISTWNVLLISVNGIIVILALLALGRILYRTSRIPNAKLIRIEKEQTDV